MFKYSPLKDDLSEIRVLSLLPSHFDSPVVISIFTVAFSSSDTLSPCPEALSYVWGSMTQRKEIIVKNDEGRTSTLSITANLAEALTYLRSTTEARSLWIDAICINQQDLNERSSQVRLMGRIYSSARRVIVWIGAKSEDSDIAIDCIKTITSKVKVNFKTAQLTPLTYDLEWADHNVPLRVSSVERKALIRLYSRSWFERLWVWQEVHLGKDVIVLCADRTIDWSAIRTGVMCLGLKHYIGGVGWPAPEAAFSIASCPMTRKLPLRALLHKTKDSKCFDPRDRIFALLSFLDEDMQSRIVPDYKKSAPEIYHEIMLQHFAIDHIDGLRLLSMVEMREEVPESPSWAPRLDLPRVATRLFNSTSALGTLPLVKCVSRSTIEITGVYIGQIRKVEPINICNDDADSELVHKVRRLKEHVMPGNAKYQNLYPFIETLTTNYVAERHHPANAWRPSVKDFPEFLDFGFGDELHDRVYNPLLSVQDALSVVRVVKNIRDFGPGRTLCTTTDGRLCLSPIGTRAGDIVTVLLGGDSPIILRPTSVDRLQYWVVGEAFCHGVMDGEALLGPLPEDWRLVIRHDRSSVVDSPAFWNSKLEQFSAEDPRLGDLPAGWRRETHKDEEFQTLFTRDVDGEQTWDDPRLTPDELRRRGVQLTTFELV